MAAMPVLIIATAIIAGSQTALTEKEMAAYGRAGGIAEEVLSSIRTVVAFGGNFFFNSNIFFHLKKKYFELFCFF